MDDPIIIDRTIARAAAAFGKWRRLLRSDASAAADDAWFEDVRPVTTRTAFQWATALPASDPLREPWRRWIYLLAVARISQPALVAAEQRRQIRSIAIDRPETAVVGVRDVVRRAIAEPVPARADQWIDALDGNTGALASAARDAFEARREIASKLGVADPFELAGVCSRTAIGQQARELVAATDDLAKAALGPARTIGGLLTALVARDVPGTWPARLSDRWIADLFRTTKLTDGVSMDLGPLAPTLGPSSFMRGLARFGAAYVRGAADRAGPFVLHNDATGTHARRRGALFAMLLCDPVFLAKKLGLSRPAARAAARALGRTVLGAVRLWAVQCALDPLRASPAEIADGTEAAWHVRSAPWLSLALPRVCDDAPSRLLAVLLAVEDRDGLIDDFDEDWFDNPRAARWLRQCDAMPPPLAISDADLSGAARRSAALIESIVA